MKRLNQFFTDLGKKFNIKELIKPIQIQVKQKPKDTASAIFEQTQQKQSVTEDKELSQIQSHEKSNQSTLPKNFQHLIAVLAVYLDNIETLRDELPDDEKYHALFQDLSKMRSKIGGEILWNLEHDTPVNKLALLMKSLKEFKEITKGNEVIIRVSDYVDSTIQEKIDTSLVLEAFDAAVKEAEAIEKMNAKPQKKVSIFKKADVRSPIKKPITEVKSEDIPKTTIQTPGFINNTGLSEHELALEAFKLNEVYKEYILMENFFENFIKNLDASLKPSDATQLYIEPLLILCSKYKEALENAYKKGSLSVKPEYSLELLLAHIKESRIQGIPEEDWKHLASLIKQTLADWEKNPENKKVFVSRPGYEHAETLLKQLDNTFNRKPLTRPEPEKVKVTKKRLKDRFKKADSAATHVATNQSRDILTIATEFKKEDQVKDLIQSQELENAVAEFRKNDLYNDMYSKVKQFYTYERRLKPNTSAPEKPDKATRKLIISIERIQDCLSKSPMKSYHKSQIRRCLKIIRENPEVHQKLVEIRNNKPGPRASSSSPA
ncbi:MAG: hypothetical protein K2X50_07120 [Gammaproteobacteria bacterium]|nr:hypothetical protein [Gammaproteobacteria bacterium]